MSDKSSGCFLCDAVAGEDDRKAFVLCRRENCFCALNKYPYNNGHLLVAPKRHAAGLADLDEEEMLCLMKLTRDAQAAIEKEMNPQGFNIGANLGEVAGAGLAGHFHMHIVPRWSGDTNFMTVLSETKVIPQSLDDLWQQLRGHFD